MQDNPKLPKIQYIVLCVYLPSQRSFSLLNSFTYSTIIPGVHTSCRHCTRKCQGIKTATVFVHSELLTGGGKIHIIP